MAEPQKLVPKDENGNPMVWDIFENTWVTREYWDYVNGRTKKPASDPIPAIEATPPAEYGGTARVLHADCDICTRLIRNAAVMARVTGSVGSTSREQSSTEQHAAQWLREVTLDA